MRKTLIIGDGFFILILIRGLLFRGYVGDKGILADYLRVHGSEVVNMLMSEYNYEQDIEVQREEAFEEGEKLGRKEGQKRFAALAEKLIEAGRSEDVIKAAQDFELCEKLYQEYDIE